MSDTLDRGGWMMTATGRKFHPFDPRPDDIDIADIAHALARICRYGGHTERFYSVAEHSVHVSRIVAPELKLGALLHDAAEAYLGDIPRPIKYSAAMAGWREAEARLESVIGERFGIPFPMHPSVKKIDDRMIIDEWAALMPATTEDIGVTGKPLNCRIRCWGVGRAEMEFLRTFRELGGC